MKLLYIICFSLLTLASVNVLIITRQSCIKHTCLSTESWSLVESNMWEMGINMPLSGVNAILKEYIR